jgi:hypothetical protein
MQWLFLILTLVPGKRTSPKSQKQFGNDLSTSAAAPAAALKP